MLRIRALNEDSNSSSNEEHEPEVTKEAQETIACSEYVRALNLKRQGESEPALNLFLELLETQVLHDATDQTKKLFSIKYNCYRNAGFLLEESGDSEKALHYVKLAVQMDDTDIYTLNKAGHLALQFDESEYAMVLFQRCQEFNPNHWPSADGILKVLCRHKDFMGAYGWAMQWHRRDETYEHAIKVLVELHEQFHPHIPMFQEMFRATFDYDKYKHIRPEPSCFSEWTYPEPCRPELKYKDLSRFRVTELTWLTVGDWITNAYEECCDTPEDLIRMHTWRDLLLREEKKNNELPEESIVPTDTPATSTTTALIPASADQDPHDSQMDTTEAAATVAKSSDESSDKDSNKPKKRRGSDLSFLEQWGWHKNRRHSRKRSAAAEQPVEPQEDVTIATFLKQAFARYYQVTFDVNESPFAPETETDNCETEKMAAEKQKPHGVDCFKAPPTEQETDFQKLTQTEFDAFLSEFEYFDMIPLLYKWLEYTSSFWRLNVPPQIAQQYVKIYSFYWTHYGFQQWTSLSCEEFKQVYTMALFYMEQVLEAANTKTGAAKAELLCDEFFHVRDQLMMHSGFYCLNTAEEFLIRICRYHWANYLLARLENNLEGCLQSLVHIVMNLERQNQNPPPPAIKLPCKRQDAVIELEHVRGLVKSLERTISLNNVGRLYAQEKFRELIPILKDSLINCTTIKSADNSVMRLRTQFEILLECLWNVSDFEGCLVWAERCFKYCIDLYETIPELSYRLKDWGAAINFILTYLEALVTKHSVAVLMALGRHQCRLVQNLVRLVVHQLDAPLDKNNPEVHAVDLRTPWILLYLVRERDEVSNCPLVGVEGGGGESNENSHDDNSGDDGQGDEGEEEEHIPKSFLLLFTAHEYLGRKLWCTKDSGRLLLFTVEKVGRLLRTPMLEPFRDTINEYMEQVTYCLFAYPPKKARSRHIEEHDAVQQELTWDSAIDLFDIYRPDVVPEFDAYKVDSISVDMEQLLQKILPLVPAHLDLSAGTAAVKEFIRGKVEKLAEIHPPAEFPHRIASIYYLIADYHFKNRDFTKPTKYYVLDLALHPWRFDSWAGLALCKATMAETRINQLSAMIGAGGEFLGKCEDAIRCFETCLKLRDKHTMLWIEYGSFAYMLQSFCSRSLKQASETLSMEAFAVLETYKEKHLKTAYNCFHTVDLYLLEAARGGKGGGVEGEVEVDDDEESHDEKWLYHYMLGKVAEKKKDPPKVYLEHYLKSSKYLYECNATYPYKINHGNPQNLSVEALEIFYRITASIMKYVEQHEVVPRDVGKLFERMLRELMTSPFTYNKAKLDNNSINALKRKMATASIQGQEEQQDKRKQLPPVAVVEAVAGGSTMETEAATATPDVVEEKIEAVVVEKKMKMDEGGVMGVAATKVVVVSPSRRISQESTATSSATTTTTSRTTTSTSSSSSSSDSSSSDDDDEEEDGNATLTERELELIYGICVKNLEECLVRFPEHYKSMNRLVHHYLYAPQKLRNMTKARELLLSTYVTSMGTKVQGLFADRKGNNFFNGIWRIPSSEIDRPGSFAAHLSKAVILLLEVLKASSEFEVTFDLAVQLHRSPDPDKKYIKDSECKELLQQTLSCCCQSFRNILRRHTAEKRNDYELVNLIVEVNKMYRKCMKQIPGKEGCFAQVMVDVYKAYVEDKVRKVPENVQELAIKFCNYEVNRRKNAEKGLPLGPVQLPGIPMALLVSSGVNVGANGKPYDAMGIPNLPRSTTISVAQQDVMVVDQVRTSVGKGSAAGVGAVNAAAATASGGVNVNTVKPRGRPAGSKNVTSAGIGAGAGATGSASSAAAMKQLMGNVDPNVLKNMSALMSLYSNPAMQSDPDTMNKMLMEYYKMLLGSTTPLAMGQATGAAAAATSATAAKSNTASQQKQRSSTGSSSTMTGKQSAQGSSKVSAAQYNAQAGTTSKAMPKYDMSSLIQSAASNIYKDPSLSQSKAQHQVAQNTISLGGGQLTITPTIAPQSVTAKGKQSSSTADEAHKLMKKTFLPDLPKSLTITAASSSSSQGQGKGRGSSSDNAKQQQQSASAKPTVTMSKVPPKADVAMQKQQQQQQMNKYAQASQMLQFQDYEMYTKSMQQAYSDLVRGQMAAVPNKAPSQQQQQKKKAVAVARGGNEGGAATGAGSSGSAYPLSAMPRFPNMAFQQDQQLKQAQMQQLLAGMSSSGGVAGTSGGGGGAPKTLQQKLAERQKANSLLESKSMGQQQQQAMMGVGQNRGGASQTQVPAVAKRKTNNNPQMAENNSNSKAAATVKKPAKVMDVIVLD